MSDSPLNRRPPPPLPLSVITGFLGAGKTTLLNELLRAPELSDTLVIINEFGEIGLDHLLVEKTDGDLMVMSSGCLCCSIRGDLITTLEECLRSRDNGRVTPFTRVIIETTGLADPAPVLHTIMFHPYLMLRFRLDGVITLVDAVNGMSTLDSQMEAVKQAAVADRIVLTKTDLVWNVGELEALKTRLTQLNPTARILDRAKGEAVPERLLDAGLYRAESKIPDVRAWLNAEAFDAPKGHDHGHDHGHHHHGHDHGHHHHHDDHAHDVNRHDAHIKAHCLTSDVALAPSSFDLFLELLRNAHGPHLLRVKGLVKLSDDPNRPVVIHGVQHVFHPPVRLEAWPDADHRTRIVFILKDMPPMFVDRMFDAFAGTPAIDRADAAGLTTNPLNPGLGGLLS